MATGSILYVIESPQVDQDILAAAQQAAIIAEVPLAVVYCLEVADTVDQIAIIKSFADLESQLKRYRIPLMILIGDRQKVLPWMGGHVKPIRIFTDTHRAREQAELTLHPVPWPGVVMTTNDLLEMIQSQDSYCSP